MNRKDIHQIKPVIDQGRDHKRNLLSLNDDTRKKGEEFPRQRSQAWSCLSKDSGALKKQGTFLVEKNPKETFQTRAGDISNLDTRAQTGKNIGQKKNSTDSAEIVSERKSSKESLTASEHPPKITEASKI